VIQRLERPEGSQTLRTFKKGGIMSDRRIEITLTAARWILNEALELVREGLGEVDPASLHGDEIGFERGLVDEIAPDSDALMWANALIHFARTVASIVATAIDNESENINPNIT